LEENNFEETICDSIDESTFFINFKKFIEEKYKTLMVDNITHVTTDQYGTTLSEYDILTHERRNK